MGPNHVVNSFPSWKKKRKTLLYIVKPVGHKKENKIWAMHTRQKSRSKRKAGSEDLHDCFKSILSLVHIFMFSAVLVPYVNALITCMILRYHYTRLIITNDNGTKPCSRCIFTMKKKERHSMSTAIWYFI